MAAMDVKGIAQVFGGDLEGGTATGLETIALSERLGEKAVRAYAFHFMSIAALRGGHLNEAVRLARSGLEIRQELGDMPGIAHLACGSRLRSRSSPAIQCVRPPCSEAQSGIWRAASGNEYQPLLADQEGANRFPGSSWRRQIRGGVRRRAGDEP